MNTTSRIGKIARLPHSIREQLNLKLHDGLPAKSILPWLNSLPDVKAILAADFDNRPISKQNLSEWKQGGHRDWLLQFHAAQFLQFIDPCRSLGKSGPDREEAQTSPSEQAQNLPDDLTEHATRNTQNTSPPNQPLGTHGTDATDGINITHKLLLWTQLQYTTMARHIDSETDPERKWNALRQFATDISRLRRSTLADDYLQIQRDWLALSQSNSIEKKEIEFCKWIKRPDIADALKRKRGGMTKELFRKIEEENLYLMGPPNPSLDEHIAEVRLAKELMARRQAKQRNADIPVGAVSPTQGSPAPAASGQTPGTAPSTPQPLPRISVVGMPFEKLFPTIPDKPLAIPRNADIPVGAVSPAPGASASPVPAAANAPSDPSDSSYQSDPSDSPALPSAFGEGGSDPVQPSQTESNQIQPGSPLNPEPNPNNDYPTPDN